VGAKWVQDGYVVCVRWVWGRCGVCAGGCRVGAMCVLCSV